MDAFVGISGCDKTIPAMVMAMARLDLPSVMLYGGSILYGEYKGRRLTIQDVFEAIGAFNAGKIDAQELGAIESRACPGGGACGGQFTANTMAMAFEVMGISPAGAAMVPAMDGSKSAVAVDAGKLVLDVLARGQRPSDIITRESLENAIAERVNGILKIELLETRFAAFREAEAAVTQAVSVYNHQRPHDSVDRLTPAEAHLRQGELKRRWKNYYRARKTEEAAYAAI